MTNPTEEAISAATHARAMEAGFQAVRDMPDVPEAANDALTVEEHLRNELQAAHEKIDALTGRTRIVVAAEMNRLDFATYALASLAVASVFLAMALMS